MTKNATLFRTIVKARNGQREYNGNPGMGREREEFVYKRTKEEALEAITPKNIRPDTLKRWKNKLGIK